MDAELFIFARRHCSEDFLADRVCGLLYSLGIKTVADFQKADINDILSQYGAGMVYADILRRMKGEE